MSGQADLFDEMYQRIVRLERMLAITLLTVESPTSGIDFEPRARQAIRLFCDRVTGQTTETLGMPPLGAVSDFPLPKGAGEEMAQLYEMFYGGEEFE